MLTDLLTGEFLQTLILVSEKLAKLLTIVISAIQRYPLLTLLLLTPVALELFINVLCNMGGCDVSKNLFNP